MHLGCFGDGGGGWDWVRDNESMKSELLRLEVARAGDLEEEIYGCS